MSSSFEFEVNGVVGGPMPLLLTPEQAGKTLAVCRTKVYELLRRGELESVQIGASRRIPSAALSDYVQRLRDPYDGTVTTK